MGAVQQVFKRVEKKYIIDDKTYSKLMDRLNGHMQVDRYGETVVRNIYYDTPDHRLIRASLEKPVYKEKLRVRSYGVPNRDSKVFVELKKKYKGVVYKRRIDMSLAHSDRFISGEYSPEKNHQIENEIRYFLKYYKGIAPAMFLSYHRIALYGTENPELRLTFDWDITYREEELELDGGEWGKKLMSDGIKVMEIKIPGAMPLWLSDILDELKIFPASFSKYGEAYKKEYFNKSKQGKVNCCA
ncbi:MAG: polyphosphate polymerase domain-containing protein [Ruminococcus sp.]|nr:polyphosphate polymerase domain-containing protein [Ruminococcus sp.]